MNSYEKWEMMEANLEARNKAIAQNGNDGTHYSAETHELEQWHTTFTNQIEDVHKERKATPVYSGVLTYFPDALKEVSKCSLAGQKQHNQGDRLYWDKNKSTDNADALVRHLIDHDSNPMDSDGVLHLSKVAWRALAVLQIYLDKQNGK